MRQLRLSLELEQLELALKAERYRHTTRQLSIYARARRLIHEIAESLKQSVAQPVIVGRGKRGKGGWK